MEDLERLEALGDYEALIREVRSRVSAGRRALVHPFLKGWCGRRYRHLFLREAVRDARAMAEATRDRPWRKDPRGDRQRIAERFLRGEGCREWATEMPPAADVTLPGTTVVFCPGLLTGLLPVRAFEEGLPELEKTFGCRVLRADSHPMRGCQANTESLADVIDRGVGRAADTSKIPPEKAVPPDGGLMMICYSKGAPDLLTLLAGRPELKERVRCVLNLCGAVGGSQVADGAQRSLRRVRAGKVEDKLQAALRPLLGRLDARDCFRKLEQTDVTDAIDDLTTAFVDSGYSLQELMVELSASPAFRYVAEPK